ncbi:MAG TPA: sigma-70 family RNA polymerase sigma factor [Xanthobacteraceae bacterium]
MPDEALMARIVNYDRSAMHMLYARHHVRVYRFALRVLRDRALSEDVVSDVFFEVWRSADQFEGRSAVSTWLLGIARLKAFSALKRCPEEELDERAANTIEDPADDPASSFERKETGSVLRECLSGLPREHREIIDLVYFHEKSIAEVAEIVGIPRNTVKTRMFSARKRLATMLQAAGIKQV